MVFFCDCGDLFGFIVDLGEECWWKNVVGINGSDWYYC